MTMYGKQHFPGRLFIVDTKVGLGNSMQQSMLKKWLESEGSVD